MLDARQVACRRTGAFALAEPEGGSGVAGGMRTTARREGDSGVLNGARRRTGEGIVVDHGAARLFADAGAVYSFEGSRETDTLVAGRAVTGQGAFVRSPPGPGLA